MAATAAATDDTRRYETDDRPVKRARVANGEQDETIDKRVTRTTDNSTGGDLEDSDEDDISEQQPEPSRASDLYLDTVW
jgi:hypothetical protein